MSQKPNQAMGPKGDVSYLRATPGPNMSIAPSPIPGRDNSHTPGAPQPAPQPHMMNNDWEDRLEIQQRELEEVRARAAQMEKTMRWWSDCTANWREKWSKVRNERNKAREENRQLRAKLDTCIKELNNLKRANEELSNKDTKSGKVVEKQLGIVGDSVCASTDSKVDCAVDNSGKVNQNVSSKVYSHVCTQTDNMEPVRQEVTVDCDSRQNQGMGHKDRKSSRSRDDLSSFEENEGSLAEDRLALLELKLEESQKTIIGERDEKITLAKTLEEVRHELSGVRVKFEEAKQGKQEIILQMERLKDQHEGDIRRLTSDLDDEVESKVTMDRRLTEFRAELEKLQKENADEWGRRERLETDKLALERENKKLRSQVSDLEDQLERKSTHATSVVSKDMYTLHTDLSEKNKELADLRHAHGKLKKTLQERLTDLEHSKRRCDQFEVEVKKLRSRVEELRRELAAAEDEVDSQSNNVRKAQRGNDELQEQVENLQVQVEHLQSRLRRSSQTAVTSHTSSVRSFSPDLQALEIADDSDEDFSEGS